MSRRSTCNACKNRFDEADLTRLPFGGVICDACIQRECEMMMGNYDDDEMSITESDTESTLSGSWNENGQETCSSPSPSPPSSSLSKFNESHILKTVDDLVRFVVEVNYEADATERRNNNSNDTESLIHSLISNNNEFDRQQQQQKQQQNTETTNSIKTPVSNINEINKNNYCSSSSLSGVKPKQILDSLRKSYEFDDMKENFSSNKRILPLFSMFEIDSKRTRFD